MARTNRHSILAALLFVALPSMASADTLSAWKQLWNPLDQTPHPAIVQILARNPDSLASGSGTLIHVDAKYGYILTNWHVVRDPQNEIMVVFPDGYRSLGTVLKMDQEWDLALVRIWRPQTSPMRLAETPPELGDPLTIAGYGPGQYRAARGRCQHFAAPAANRPQDMIEVTVTARQGDSGGPIINQQGELAAILFGTGQGLTTGTHVGRIAMFLAQLPATANPLARQTDPATPQPPIRTREIPQDSSALDTQIAETPLPPAFFPATPDVQVDSPRPDTIATADTLSPELPDATITPTPLVAVPTISRDDIADTHIADTHIADTHIADTHIADTPSRQTPIPESFAMPAKPPRVRLQQNVTTPTEELVTMADFTESTLWYWLKSGLAFVGTVTILSRFLRGGRGMTNDE